MGLARAARSAGGVGRGRHAHLLVGALPYSGRWRAVLAEAEDFAQLVEAWTRTPAGWAG